jgi:hypothetical protein
MAYSPTTWNTNDVITKDKLNKIEQGVKTGTLLSGTDIDTDKDWNGKSIVNISSLSSSIYTSTNVKLLPINLGPIPKTIRKSFTGSRSDKGTVDLGTFTIPSEYIEGSIIGVEGWVQIVQLQTYTASANINVKVNGVTVKTFQAYAYGHGLTIKVDFEDYIPIKGNDVISVTLVGSPAGSQYDISGCSGNIVFFGEDVLPSVCVHPTWS